YPVIIDNMMNLELLMRAARYFQLDTLRSIAITHARTTLRTHFRDDFTTFHLVDFDPQTGAVVTKKTVQGYSDTSVWARGEAWALYGYAMMARECAKCGLTAESREFLAQATGIGKWVAAHLPADGIPYWDFSDPAIPDTWRDASAAAILASGFLDLARQLDSQDAALAKRFRKLARRQLKTLASAPYLAKAGQNGGFLLQHCVGNLPAGSEIDVPLTYADYYFLEALLRWQEK
ncbi:MAG: glycoside hydrolase family 88 protein, partial [Bacteroidales bacterium]|nr:glycoside hydrolase family 88 protein [Bacteroidales bacterium]